VAQNINRRTWHLMRNAKLSPGDRLQARLWHAFSDQVRADVSFQTRRLGDSS
jgi:hypothetical protein